MNKAWIFQLKSCYALASRANRIGNNSCCNHISSRFLGCFCTRFVIHLLEIPTTLAHLGKADGLGDTNTGQRVMGIRLGGRFLSRQRLLSFNKSFTRFYILVCHCPNCERVNVCSHSASAKTWFHFVAEKFSLQHSGDWLFFSEGPHIVYQSNL